MDTHTHHEQPQEEHREPELPDKIELLRQLKAEEEPEAPPSFVQVVVVAVCRELYGFKIFSVREILKMQKLTWVPCTPEWLIGVISVRGDVQIVVDLQYLLQRGLSQIAETSRIVLVEALDVTAGFLVEEMLDILDVPEENLLPLADTATTLPPRYIVGKFPWNDQMVTLLDVEAIVREVSVNQT
jgi:purine-binding chemotaxis protein CheW